MADQIYEVRINGLVSTEGLLEQLRDVQVAEHELRTVLSGHFVDQAELYGFLNLLRSYGLEVVERVPIEVAAGPQNQHYLQTKRDKLGHLLEGL